MEEGGVDQPFPSVSAASSLSFKAPMMEMVQQEPPAPGEIDLHNTFLVPYAQQLDLGDDGSDESGDEEVGEDEVRGIEETKQPTTLEEVESDFATRRVKQRLQHEAFLKQQEDRREQWALWQEDMAKKGVPLGLDQRAPSKEVNASFDAEQMPTGPVPQPEGKGEAIVVPVSRNDRVRAKAASSTRGGSPTPKQRALISKIVAHTKDTASESLLLTQLKLGVMDDAGLQRKEEELRAVAEARVECARAGEKAAKEAKDASIMTEALKGMKERKDKPPGVQILGGRPRSSAPGMPEEAGSGGALMVVRGQSRPSDSSSVSRPGFTNLYHLSTTNVEDDHESSFVEASAKASQIPLQDYTELYRPLASPQPSAPSGRFVRPGTAPGEAGEPERISSDFALTGVGGGEMAPPRSSHGPGDPALRPQPPSLGRPQQRKAEAKPSSKVLLGLVAGRPLTGASAGKASMSPRPKSRVAVAKEMKEEQKKASKEETGTVRL